MNKIIALIVFLLLSSLAHAQATRVGPGVQIKPVSAAPTPVGSGNARIWVKSGDGKPYFTNGAATLHSPLVEAVRLYVADGAITAGDLVKLSTATLGRAVKLAAADSAALMLGVAVTAAAGAGNNVEVLIVENIESTCKSDGTATITFGTCLEKSGTVDGKVKQGTCGSTSQIGKATTSAAATLDASVGCQ